MRRKTTGLTLVEITITTVILSMALLPLLRGYFGSVRGVTESLDETRDLAYAERLMNRILSNPWEEPSTGGAALVAASRLGPEMNETDPSDYDDVDDWNGYEGSDPDRPRAKSQARVDFVDPNTGEEMPSFQTSNVKRVVVEVRREGRGIALTCLKVRP